MTSARRDDWDRHWQQYADTAEQNPAQNYRREIILSLLDLAGAGEGSRIIDIGSGQGDMAAAIRARFRAAEILGISLKTLHNKLKEYGSTATEAAAGKEEVPSN